jgi:hypothetical protein
MATHTTTEHFTAWLTCDTSCLDQPNADVVVLRDELRGEPDDPNAWFSTTDEHFRAVTNVEAKGGDHDDMIREAESLLDDAGWKIDGAWEPVDTGYIVPVTRS